MVNSVKLGWGKDAKSPPTPHKFDISPLPTKIEFNKITESQKLVAISVNEALIFG